MKTTWTAKIDSILKIGRSLEDIGIRNWGLEKDAALAALDQLLLAETAVVGGDVFEVRGDKVRTNHDNWYCSRHPHEPDDSFVKRSNIHAKTYISAYNSKSVNVLFAIVPDVLST